MKYIDVHLPGTCAGLTNVRTLQRRSLCVLCDCVVCVSLRIQSRSVRFHAPLLFNGEYYYVQPGEFRLRTINDDDRFPWNDIDYVVYGGLDEYLIVE